MVLMTTRSRPPNRFVLSRRQRMANQPIPPSSCILFSSWHRVVSKVFMRILQVGFLSLWFVLVSSFPALSQDSTSSPQITVIEAAGQPQAAPPPATFNDVMDRVIQK